MNLRLGPREWTSTLSSISSLHDISSPLPLPLSGPNLTSTVCVFLCVRVHRTRRGCKEVSTTGTGGQTGSVKWSVLCVLCTPKTLQVLTLDTSPIHWRDVPSTETNPSSQGVSSPYTEYTSRGLYGSDIGRNGRYVLRPFVVATVVPHTFDLFRQRPGKCTLVCFLREK